MVEGQDLRATASFLLFTCMACGGDGSATLEHAEWVTELEYRFTGTVEQGVLFNWAFTRVDPYRERIFVVDPMETQVSVWNPNGSLRFVVGRKGEGPGEFTQPSRVYYNEDGGFSVQEGWGTRFTHYTADGVLKGTEIGTTPALHYQDTRVGIEAPTADGGYVARPLYPASIQAGLRGDPPIERQPLLLVRRTESGQWLAPEPIYWQDTRNQLLAVIMDDGHTFTGQYFGDDDRTAFAHGRILVMRRSGGPPGSLDLLELNALGDTLWERRLQFEPHSLTAEWVQEIVDSWIGAFPRPGMSRAEQLRYREAFEEALYKPEYLPAAGSFFLSASDDVWLKTFERVDTLRVYYIIPRGDASGEPRRVLLPEAMQADDATATHVWGTRDDAFGVPYVVGRKLIPPR